MLRWTKNKALQSQCPHEWHEVGRVGKISFASEAFYYAVTLYCPLCEKNLKVKEDKSNQILKQQEIRRTYSSDFRI